MSAETHSPAYRKYDIIYSLGANCACASHLKTVKLRTASGPFDWLCGADLKTRCDIICNGFDEFCTKKYFRKTEEQEPQDHNISYLHTKYGLYFKHDFPKDVGYDSMFPVISEKYTRRIQRFLSDIRKSRTVLLVWMEPFSFTPDEVLTEVYDRLAACFHKDFDFLVITHKECDIPEVVELTPRITRKFLNINESDAQGNYLWGGTKQTGELLFSDYAVAQKKIYYYYTKFMKMLVQMLCCFIPSRSLRKRVRQRFRA